MRKYTVGQNFNVVVSTKATLYGAQASNFKVSYAPTNDLLNRTEVANGIAEAVDTIETPKTATLASASKVGSVLLTLDTGHSFESGEVIEYQAGSYAYISKVVGDKLYLKTRLRADLAIGDTVTQVGNTGLYKTDDFAIQQEGEYLVTIESPEYGVMVESRIGIVEQADTPTVDGDAPIYTEIAVAY